MHPILIYSASLTLALTLMLRDHYRREMLVVISSLTVEYRGEEWSGVEWSSDWRAENEWKMVK
jgi:hypothetical protein